MLLKIMGLLVTIHHQSNKKRFSFQARGFFNFSAFTLAALNEKTFTEFLYTNVMYKKWSRSKRKD